MKELDSVSGIEKIWDDDRLPPIRMSNFGVQSLTTLTVRGCDKLKYVFTSGMVKSFVQLKTLEVCYCGEMEEVIQGILGEGEKQVFPKLDFLNLYSLPNLKRFCSGINPIEFPSLKRLEIRWCYRLKRFHCDVTNVVGDNISRDLFLNQKILFPCLEYLKLYCMNITRIWDNQLATTSWCSQNLQSLTIEFCGHLEYLLSHSAARCLVQLERLEIISCKRIGEIIQAEEKLEEIVDARILFPKLHSIRMEYLPKLRRFSSSSSIIEFPNLKKVIVEHCPELETYSREVLTPKFREQFNPVKTKSKRKLKVEGASGSGRQGESQGMSSSHEIELEAAQKDLEIILELSDKIRQSTEAASMPTLSTPSSGAIMEPVAAIPSMELGETGVGAMTAIEQGVSKILECMATPTTIGRIVVHGVCGIGKSSVLRALVNNPKIKQLGFDFVIFVTVSKYWTLMKIKDQIIQQLSPASSDAEPFQILEGKKILLLLDDVWEWVDLPDIGIPHLSLKGGSTMVLATRELKACADMEVTGVVEIEPLSKEEAWTLFCAQVGGVPDSESIRLFAQGIAEGCCGLPLLIIATGRALADEENAAVWKDACNKFSVPGRDIRSDMEELIQLLKFSFDSLKSRSLKSCLLHCALFPDDREIDTSKFIEYCIQEGLITGTWSDAHERGHDIVKALRQASLLETTEDGLFIRMPYVMKDLALGIMSSDIDSHQFLLTSYSKQSKEENRSSSTRLLTNDRHQFFLKAAASLTEPPTEDDWKKSKMMFLMDNELSVLPERPDCPELKMLFLQRNHQLRVLPDLFFDNMCCLTVLNLSMTRIKYLPKSISKLERLETLILRDCERLVKLPSDVGSLKPLQVLDLGGTEIIELPAEIAELDSLCHLEVSFYGSSTSGEHAKLPSNLFSRLQALETLHISVYPGDNWWNKNAKSVVEEVNHLNKLTSLSFNFPDVEFLELFLQESTSWKEERLTDFKIIVGRDIKFNASRVPLSVKQKYASILGQCLRFVNSEMIPAAVVEVLAHCTAFYLDHHVAVIHLSEFGIHRINKLKYCIVSECPCLETIIAVKEETEVVFPFLEHLSIHYCWSLTCIWKGVRSQRSFEGLRTLSLSACPKLTYVFESSMLRFISNLEKLEVDDCEAIEQIVSSDEEKTGSYCISLKSLTLHHLPELVHVGEGVQTKLLFEYVSIYDCPRLKLDFVDSKLKDTLKKISADKDWWDGLEWEETAVRSYFKSIFTPIPDDSVMPNYQ